MSVYEHLQVEQRGGAAWVTMHRPERLNAMNPRLIAELMDFFTRLQEPCATRVVVLRGAGRSFCAGLDLQEMQDSGARKGVGDMLEVQRKVRDIMLRMRRCPQPIVSIVQGAASGGGMALALASDVRLMTPDARMNAAFIRVGLSGCDVGVSYFLPRMVGASVASELLLTRRFLNAQRALALGLASQVDELPALEREAEALATEMLQATPLGLRLTKDALNFALDAPSLEAAIAMEDRNQILCTQGDDFSEGIAAFLQKRPPVYGKGHA